MNGVWDWFDEEQVSINVDDDEILAGSGSDNEESSSGPRELGFMAGVNGMVILEDGSKIKRILDMGMGRYEEEVNVVAIHKITYPGLIGQARVETFRIFSEAVAKKCGGNASVMIAWYGGSRNEIVSAVHHGFSHSHCHRTGVHLTHPMSPIDGFPYGFSQQALQRLSDEEDHTGAPTSGYQTSSRR